MAKVSLHEAKVQGFLCACAMRSYAERLANDARDFGWSEAANMARHMREEAEMYIKKLK